MMNTNEKYLYRLFEKKLQESSNIVDDRKQCMGILRDYIKTNLDPNTFIFPSSGRHVNEEIVRINTSGLGADENAVENALKEIFGEPVEGVYTVEHEAKTISFTCDFSLVPGPSGSYLAFQIIFNTKDTSLPAAYISDCTHRIDGKKKFGKKLFTPNAILNPSLVDGTYKSIDEIIQGISYGKTDADGGNILTTLLKELVKSAKLARTDNQVLIEYLTTPVTELSGKQSPTNSSIKITFQPTNELQDIIKQIGPQEMEKLSAAIYVDFGEVIGAVALATVLGKNGEVGIAYPSQSNYALVDYFLKPLNDNLQEFKVSAKAGAGGKPTLNAPCKNIMRVVENQPELRTTFKDTIDFITWIQGCLDGNTVHGSFEKMANYLVEVVEGTATINFLKNTEYYTLLKNKQKEIIDIANMDTSIENLLDLVTVTNKTIQYIMQGEKDVSYIQEKGIWGIEKFGKVNVATYFNSLRIKCLTTILINIINNSFLMESFNQLFNLSFGTFIQLYAKNITNTINENTVFEFEGVLKSIDGENIGGQSVYYKLVFDCNIDSNSGIFKTKSLAMKLMHSKMNEQKYGAQLKSLQEKYERISALRTIHEEIYHMCTSNKLEEENAQKYFTFLINEGLKNIDFSLQGKQLDGELDYVNMNRFNQQIKEPNIRKNYFEGKTLEQFKQSFYKFVNVNKDLDSKSKRQLRIVLNNYVDKFKNSNLKRYASWD